MICVATRLHWCAMRNRVLDKSAHASTYFTVRPVLDSKVTACSQPPHFMAGSVGKLKGCGPVASDSNPLDGGEEKAFETALRRRGLETFVVPVERSDWLKVASAVITPDFWRGTCRPDGPAYNWYLQKVRFSPRRRPRALPSSPDGVCSSLHRRTPRPRILPPAAHPRRATLETAAPLFLALGGLLQHHSTLLR